MSDTLKFDGGKPRPAIADAYFPTALEEIAAISHWAIETKGYKYGSWRLVDPSRYREALRRHQLASARGEATDAESGFSHTSHIAWNAMALCELEKNK